MNTCSRSHCEIMYPEDSRCPLCVLKEELDDSSKEIISLHEKVIIQEKIIKMLDRKGR